MSIEETFKNEKMMRICRDPIFELGSTHLRDTINIKYHILVALFGEPDGGDGDKTDAEWVIIYKGKPLTIYNYKNGINYLRHRGTPTAQITEWNIGGNDDTDVDSFKALVEVATKSMQDVKDTLYKVAEEA